MNSYVKIVFHISFPTLELIDFTIKENENEKKTKFQS